MLTLDEIERAAYIRGYTETVQLIARLEDEVSDGLILTHQEELEQKYDEGYLAGLEAAQD